jgi:MFS family permease
VGAAVVRRVFSFGFSFEAFNRDVRLICISNAIGAFGEGLYFWVFPLYIRSLQADYVQLGIVFSALFGVAALVPIPGGLLADRFDRKKLLILSWAPWVFAPLIYSFAGNWMQLIPGTFLWGLSMLGLPVITAYVITSVTDKRQSTSVLAFVWASYSFSYIFAPATGGYLATVIGMPWVLRLSTVFAAVSTIIFFFLHSQHPRKDETQVRVQSAFPVERKRLWRMMLVWAGFYTAMAFFTSIVRPYVPTFLSEQIKLSEFYVGLFGSVNYAGVTFLGIAVGRLGDRWPKSRAMTLCLIFYLMSVFPLLFVRDAATLMFVAFLFGGSAVSGSIVSSFVGTIAPRDKQALWLSIPQTLSLLAAFAAPYLGGYLYTLSPHFAFIVSLSGIPFLALFASRWLREEKKTST